MHCLFKNLSSKLQKEMVRRKLAIEEYLLKKKKKKSAPFFEETFARNKRLSDSPGTRKFLFAVPGSSRTYSKATREPCN